MADRFSVEKRRQIMRAVRTRHTAPERALAAMLRELGVIFRRHVKDLAGTPDFYFPAIGTAVFVHGCFWHGHRACPKGRHRPKTNRRFWANKLEENRRRDRRIARRLRAAGMSVYTVWECEVEHNRLPTRLRRRLVCAR
jgi:DNA mismatch endonuclease (patch repair protein)